MLLFQFPLIFHKNSEWNPSFHSIAYVSYLLIISKAFEKLVNNRIVDHLEKCNLFSDFGYSFRSSADLLTVASDRIARVFNCWGYASGSTWYIQGFWQVWRAGLLHKLRSYGTAGQIFGLISSFLSNRQLQVVLDRKSSQEYPVNPQGSILGTTLFQLYINDLLMILLVIHGVTWCNLTQTKKIQKKFFL